MAQFCKDFNEKSEEMYERDTPLRVELRLTGRTRSRSGVHQQLGLSNVPLASRRDRRR
eukprot:CAMPEP_0113479806 /NCGR_PEP_ID=MMETSP0014_2-20120614/21523_1 /TAXON_ID=2857 /ORGANISM="Nitzschia sp." /LENGTH=57 /DNA_ID=CAMNT_0000373163 /DNA_START=10 /DNA_END=179 /DNA_ORIENTATION=+ /assembly_acc=CAM_ASM_000159